MRWFEHVERSDGRIAQVCKLHRRDNAGQTETWAKVLQDGKKKLGRDLATINNGLNGEGVCDEDLSERPTLGRGKWTFTCTGYLMMK